MKKGVTIQKFKLILISLVILTVGVHCVTNLYYNSPFNDEAVYVVIGKLGIFSKDWDSLYAVSWTMGHPYLYTPLTAIAYEVGGIAASRLINVTFFLLLLMVIYKITSLLDDETPILASLIAVIVLGFSSIGYYVSRLATYDMPAFFFFSLSLYYFIKAFKKSQGVKYNFLASASLFFVAFGFKYVIAIYTPLYLVLWAYLVFQKDGTQKQMFYYFLVPLAFLLSAFALIYRTPLTTLYFEQVAAEEKETLLAVLVEFIKSTNVILLLYTIVSASILFFRKRDVRIWVAVSAAGFWILLSHLVSLRVHTLDKHAFLSASAMAVAVGIGLPKLFKNKPVYKLTTILLIFACLVYSCVHARTYNSYWINTDRVDNYLSKAVKPDDLVLTELGDSTTLALVDTLHPERVTTFDYFEYGDESGYEAYGHALDDAYFTYVVLVSGGEYLEYYQDANAIHTLVRESLTGYKELYKDETATVYTVH